MAKDIFAEDFEDKTEARGFGFDQFEKKIKASAIEKAGFVMAAAIILVVIAVMTLDIRFITISEIKDFSIEAFLLLFLCNAMYGNMYQSGRMGAKKGDKYQKVMQSYAKIKGEIKEAGLMKRLRAFCKEFVDNELKTCKLEILDRADVSWEEYQRCKNLSKNDLKFKKRLSDVKVKAILDANWIVPIKLSADMLYREGGNGGIRYSALRSDPKRKSRSDIVLNFIKTAATSIGMCFLGAEILADPSWQTVCVVAAKVLTVALNGYNGYIHGYNNVAVTEVNFTEDQIDLLEQYKVWRGSEMVFSTVPDVPSVPAIVSETI